MANVQKKVKGHDHTFKIYVTTGKAYHKESTFAKCGSLISYDQKAMAKDEIL